MVDTKPLAQVQKNYDDSIGSVPGKYAAGIQVARDWQGEAIKAEELFAQKMQEAISAKRRAENIAKVSNSEWKTAAADKGAKRIGAGMTAAKAKFGKGISEVLTVIQGVSIAPRSADPMANVDGRVKPIVAALAAMKK